MAQGKKGVDFSMDEGETGIVLGYLNGISKNISTRQYIDSAVQYATQELSAAFEEEADNAAKSASENFYHVYNWGDTYGDRSTVGLPQFRLWKLVTMGTGKSRTLGFTFLPETRPTPIEPEIEDMVVSGVHIFTWKAPVMEYGIEVTIAPKLPGVKNLVFVMDGEVISSSKPITTTPGYRTTTGVFTSFFKMWWEQVAPMTFDTRVRPVLESDVITNRDLAKVAKQATRRRRKDLGINILDTRTGESLARKHMEDNKVDYVRRARRRRMNLYGY